VFASSAPGMRDRRLLLIFLAFGALCASSTEINSQEGVADDVLAFTMPIATGEADDMEVEDLEKVLDALNDGKAEAKKISGSASFHRAEEGGKEGLEAMAQEMKNLVEVQEHEIAGQQQSNSEPEIHSRHHSRRRKMAGSGGAASQFISRMQTIASKHLQNLQRNLTSLETERQQTIDEYTRKINSYNEKMTHIKDEIKDLDEYLPGDDVADEDATGGVEAKNSIVFSANEGA